MNQTAAKSPPDSHRTFSANEAIAKLEQGNAAFVGRFQAANADGGTPPREVQADSFDPGNFNEDLAQEPFALVLGCADARAPVELIFNQRANDLFVLRVAGNVLGQEIIGSIDYAIQHLPSIRLLVVLGHTHCGAVTAAVEAYLDPAAYLGLSGNHQLRAIVNQLFPAVRLAYGSLVDVCGRDVSKSGNFDQALTTTATAINAALMASLIQSDLKPHNQEQVEAVFSTYDLETRSVDVAGLVDQEQRSSRLFHPPTNAAEFKALGLKVASGPKVTAWLEG